MRLSKFLSKVEEEGEGLGNQSDGTGLARGTTTQNVAVYARKIQMSRRFKRKKRKDFINLGKGND